MQKEDTLKNYINELVKLSKKGLPSQKTINELFRKHKLEPEHQHKLDILISRHLERAEIGMNHGNFHSALQELERASRLNPREVDIYIELAQIYLTRYHAQGEQENDRLLAERSINRCLILNPKSGVAKLVKKEINSLDKKRKHKRKIIWLLVSLIPISILTLLIILNRNFIFNFIGINQNTSSSQTTTPFSLEDNRFPTYKNLPLTQQGFASNNLSLSLYKSEVVLKNDAFAFQLQGVIETDNDLEKLTLNLKMLDNNYNTMDSEEIELIKDGDPILREGQSITVDKFEYISEIPGDIHSIELTVSEAIMKEYVNGDTPLNMELFWGIGRPDGVRLNINLREDILLVGYDRMYWKYIFDFKNRGSKEITRLNLNCEFYGDNGELFLTENWTTIQTGSVPMKPGEERVIELNINQKLDRDFHYSAIALRVMGIETE